MKSHLPKTPIEWLMFAAVITYWVLIIYNIYYLY